MNLKASLICDLNQQNTEQQSNTTYAEGNTEAGQNSGDSTKNLIRYNAFIILEKSDIGIEQWEHSNDIIFVMSLLFIKIITFAK